MSFNSPSLCPPLSFIKSEEIDVQRTVSGQTLGAEVRDRTTVSGLTVPFPASCVPYKSIRHTWTQLAKWDVSTNWKDLQNQSIQGQ